MDSAVVSGDRGVGPGPFKACTNCGHLWSDRGPSWPTRRWSGEKGSTIALRGGTAEAPDGAVTIRIPAARVSSGALDPTGVGDAFRAGLLAARRRGLPWEVAGRAGSVAAVFALETQGAQPEWYSRAAFVARYAENFGTGGIHAAVTAMAHLAP